MGLLEPDARAICKLDGAENQSTVQIRSAGQELRSLQSRGGDQEAFLKFASEFRLVNMATAWQMARPEQKKRVQTFLFEAGLSYSPKTKSLNPITHLFLVFRGSFWLGIKFGVPDGI